MVRGPRGKLIIEVFDKNGNVEKKHEQPTNSWLANFYALMTLLFHFGKVIKMVDSSGYIRNFSNTITYTWDLYSGAGCAIQVGSSDKAFDVQDYKLGSPILWSVVDNSDFDPYGGRVTFSAIIHPSADIVIKETGILYVYIYNTSGGRENVLVERTVLTEPITVKANQYARINYVIEFM